RPRGVIGASCRWLITAVAIIIVSDAFAQPAPPPTLVPPRLSADEAEAFKQSMAAYQACTREKASEMQLTEAAMALVSYRDHRAVWEAELSRNASLRLRYPNGYAQMVSETFAAYRSLGGPASAVDAVQRVPPPCTNPWDTYRAPRVPITDSRQI